VLGYGADVVVESPEEIRSTVVDRLRRLAEVEGAAG
jgi:predicted DNA-binding transcriptional regulator YafY